MKSEKALTDNSYVPAIIATSKKVGENIPLVMLASLLICFSHAGCSSGKQENVGVSTFAVEGETCGNGVLDVHPAPPPTCPKPNKKTDVRSRAQLDAWLADPTTSLSIKDDIAFSGESLEIITACNVFTTSPAQLTGLTDLFISARNVDISSDIEATGRLEFRGEQSVVIRQSSTLDGPIAGLALDAPTVDNHGDATYQNLFCVEGGSIIVRQSSHNTGNSGELILIGDDVDIHGDFINPGIVTISSAGDIVFRQAAKIENASDFSMVSGAFLDFHGDLLSVGQVTVTAAGDLT